MCLEALGTEGRTVCHAAHPPAPRRHQDGCRRSCVQSHWALKGVLWVTLRNCLLSSAVGVNARV